MIHCKSSRKFSAIIISCKEGWIWITYRTNSSCYWSFRKDSADSTKKKMRTSKNDQSLRKNISAFWSSWLKIRIRSLRHWRDHSSNPVWIYWSDTVWKPNTEKKSGRLWIWRTLSADSKETPESDRWVSQTDQTAETCDWRWNGADLCVSPISLTCYVFVDKSARVQ